MHVPRGDYDCDDCPFWIELGRKCVLHGPSDVVLEHDTCNYFVLGAPGMFGQEPLSLLTKQQSGFTSSHEGFGCKRCVAFDREDWACSEVNKDSPGDDPQSIHPDGCCNLWKPDPKYGSMPSEVLKDL